EVLQRARQAGAIAVTSGREAGPHIVHQAVVVFRESPGQNLLTRSRVVKHVEIAELLSSQSREKHAGAARGRREQISSQSKLKPLPNVGQHRIELLADHRSQLRDLFGAALAGDLLQELFAGAVGEYQRRRTEVLIQIGGLGELRQGLPFA